MKIYTSYFYQIRFFPKNLVPLSTAVWDPKWYHANRHQDYTFKDKRGVINGLRAEVFMPRDHGANAQCRGPEGCPYVGKSTPCPFLLMYKIQLDGLDFNYVMERFNILAAKIREGEHFNDVDFALIFHEVPTKLCSERGTVQRWFAEHDMQIVEWSKELI